MSNQNYTVYYGFRDELYYTDTSIDIDIPIQVYRFSLYDIYLILRYYFTGKIEDTSLLSDYARLWVAKHDKSLHYPTLPKQIKYIFSNSFNIELGSELYFPDSNWKLSAIIYDRELLVSIRDITVPGILYDKLPDNYTDIELAQECWYQMLESSSGLMMAIRSGNVTLENYDTGISVNPPFVVVNRSE